MKKRKLSLILFFFVILLFIFTFNITPSRYMGKIDSEADDIIAIPILNLTNSTLEETINGIYPGSITETDFFVSNYDDVNKNEVLMKYYIKVQTNNEIPVKISLTDENEAEVTLNEEGQSEERDLPYDTQMQTKYHIKIEWDKKDNSYEYANKSLKLTLEVVATQVVERS